MKLMSHQGVHGVVYHFSTYIDIHACVCVYSYMSLYSKDLTMTFVGYLIVVCGIASCSF